MEYNRRLEGVFFLQMSGFPGAGKSTLAREIGKRTGAVVIDHDVVKSALLHAIDDGTIDPKLAGKISYNIDWSLIEFQLSQGIVWYLIVLAFTRRWLEKAQAYQINLM
jgi:adenylate kinase family enzyme